MSICRRSRPTCAELRFRVPAEIVTLSDSMTTFDPADVWLHDDVLTVDLAEWGWADGIIRRAIVRGDLPHTASRSFTGEHGVDVDDLVAPGLAVRGDHVTAEGRAVLLVGADAVVTLSIHGLHVGVTVAAADPDRRDELVEHFVALFPTVAEDPDQVPVSFVYNDNGPTRIQRLVRARAWADVRAHYPRSATGALDQLMKVSGDPSGRIVLFHGPPGTGKSSALLTLAREWRDWCDVAFVLDPDSLFAGSPGYLVQVILESSGDRWTLLVIEDAADLLRPTGADGMHPGLARMLNVTDGAIGQGLRVLVCVTTNEPIASLHPAIRRPGRCLADISIGPLSPSEAAALLPEGSDVRADMSLAEVLAARGDLAQLVSTGDETPTGLYL